MEVENVSIKPKRKNKDIAAPSVKKEHVNVIFIGHVGEYGRMDSSSSFYAT